MLPNTPESPPPSFPPVSPFTDEEWRDLLGCVGFAAARAQDISEDHPGVAIAFSMMKVIRRVLGEDKFDAIVDAVEHAADEERRGER